MSVELIEKKHFLLSLTIVIVSAAAFYLIARPISEEIRLIHMRITTVGFVLVVGVTFVFLQYLENLLLWSKLLNLKDNLSFFGVSLGAVVCIFIFGS